ncbi:hypothetical protein HAX54_040111 [Datura stramonium]|uniref:CBS domain-containing protein n=1 Tax=Datura stramonium TaxID=4076 RepID=A0ABS8SJS8_DATST|nr:hypothetical protein [Datura stramonium]
MARILLIPVLGGVIVGMLHGLLEILDQITQTSSSLRGQGFDLLAEPFPTVAPGGCDFGNWFQMQQPFAVSFAIETVLRPLQKTHSFTTAMIILASVISSTASNAILGEKGSGLVEVCMQLLTIGAVGAVFGGSVVELINSAIPGTTAIAQPQATPGQIVYFYTLQFSLFDLAVFDYSHAYFGEITVLVEVMTGSGGIRRQVCSKDLSLSPDDKNEGSDWRHTSDRNDLELSEIGCCSSHESLDESLILEDLKVSQAMSNDYLKVFPNHTVKEALERMANGRQSFVIVVNAEDYLEGILTYGDIKRSLFNNSGDSSNRDLALKDANACLVSSICTRGINYHGQECGLLTCYPDTDLAIAKQIMVAKGTKQLPVQTKRVET